MQNVSNFVLVLMNVEPFKIHYYRDTCHIQILKRCYMYIIIY